MGEAKDGPIDGEYFSRNYLQTETPFADDQRARHRLGAYLSEYFSGEGYKVGKFIEQELGIQCLSNGPGGYYLAWGELLRKLKTSDLLDVLTAVIRFQPKKTRREGPANVTSDLLGFTSRVFLEQNLAYKIDSSGGIHPIIDTTFSIMSFNLIRNLSANGLEAAREHVTRAERNLLAGEFDPRGAIRSTFDAAENLFKVIFPRATQLNAQAIREKLGPYLVDVTFRSKLEHQAAEKLVSSLVDWTEAAHFYRHASGGTEPEQPSDEFAIAFVSQGFAFVRWIGDTYARKSAATSE